MAIGKVKLWNDERGFGFIVPSDGGPDAFVHVSVLKRVGIDGLSPGEAVEYELGQDPHTGKQRVSALRMA